MVRGMVYAICSAVCFGMLAIMGKLAFGLGMGSLEILQYRFAFAALILFAYFALTAPAVLRPRPKTIAKAALLGLGLYPVQSFCFLTSLRHIPASTAALILYFYPVVVTLLSMLFFRIRVGRAVAASLALLVLGCALVFYDAFLRSIAPQGLFLAVAAMLIFSTYLIILQRIIKGEDTRSITFYVILCTACVYTAIAPPTGFLAQPAQVKLLAVGLGLVPTALAVALLYRSVELVGSAYASIFSTFEPITTVLASALILGEAVLPLQIAGMAAILAGIALPNLGALAELRQKRTPSQNS